ncbi:heme lyase CcmF/NrfE family subunit [uncultured Piscinibacter sp.]|uniref:heme lyase CcmF/NrfE family subunit n=1 Tax=uncultured Piscinibacter sp. TaxID=1131835 RepID=UPI0026026792|nr:heme lyase CcmF/NrfE family subunit [uncultured Piscinibacter sp.]
MLPELGHFALVLALFIALALGTLPIIGAARGDAAAMSLARPAAQALFLFVAIAFGSLMASFVANDFSVLNVASHSNTELPLPYRIAATWGSHEGSMLLWVFMLSLWMLAVSLFSKRLPADMVARVLGVMGFVSVGFLLFILLTSNPFQRLVPPALDGRDLNPLLQDPGMVIHPPLLYMGYVGFAVAFAFAVSALLSGRFDAAWARWSRPWTTAAWVFLTLGIAIGSWWAYYELGWGGWWFWDPVENASFMPWLVGTALIHSLAVAEKRGAFKAWTVLLAIAAFSLSLLGTFLVRSGVLTSVHAFATDPTRGIFILAFLLVVVGGSLALFGWRAASVGFGGRFDRVSRESLLLANNLLLLTAAASVMLGTLYPLVLDALGLGKISVGAPYFETVFVPLMAPVVLLMGVGPLARWKASAAAELARKLRWPAALSVVAALALPVLAGRWSPGVALGMLLAAWVFASTAAVLAQRLRGEPGAGLRSRFAQLARSSPSFFGMVLGHLGVGVFIVGVTLVKGYEIERDVKMGLGDTIEVAGYQFTFQGTQEFSGPNYVGMRGTLEVRRGEDAPFTMTPEKRLYKVQQMPMTEAAIDVGLTRDLYVSLGEPIDENTWTVRVYHKPFVDWIWFGALLMAAGGLLAAADRRYRVALRRDEMPVASRRAVGAAVTALCLLLVAAPLFAAPAQPVAADPALEARVNRLSAELRCLVCQNQSLADSHAPLALDLKNQVREQLQAGRSDDQVIEYMTQRYGDFVLYRPPMKTTTALLWGGPLLLLIVGAGLLWRALARSEREALASPLPPLDAVRWDELPALADRAAGADLANTAEPR